MTFTEALAALKTGGKVRRESWKPSRAIYIDEVYLLGNQTAVNDVIDEDFAEPAIDIWFCYEPSGDDVFATDWVEFKE